MTLLLRDRGRHYRPVAAVALYWLVQPAALLAAMSPECLISAV